MIEETHEEYLLKTCNLKVTFNKRGRQVHAVRNVSLTVRKGEVVGLVGESGSGKSVTAMAITGLIHNSKTVVVEGDILFQGKKLATDGGNGRLRSRNMNMIFQDPTTSLNPAMTIGYQLEEVFMAQHKMVRKQARAKSFEMLRLVEFLSPEFIARQYPHQLSGGMCQRVMIAIALSGEPELLIADEPTTALDVTIQAHILQLLHELYATTKTSILFITHDLGIIAQFCHSAAIMLEGEIVETGKVPDIFRNPLHPYTRGLLNSIPVIGKKERLIPMEPAPDIPLPLNGCGFYSRCPKKTSLCKRDKPGFVEFEPDHFVRCFSFAPVHSPDHG